MSQLDQLSIVSYLAPNMFWFYTATAAYLNRVFGIKTQLVQSELDPLLDPQLLEDRLDLGFICGLPFIRRDRTVPNQLIPLVAPVMQARRYQNRPIYFSDVIVNAQSHLKTFDDLAGTTLCFNDTGSNSGYNLLRHKLMQAQHPPNFFSKTIQSGSHQNSIQQVINRQADCAAIDSTVLEQEIHNTPNLVNHLRVVESIGPCPMPPVVAAQHLGTEFLQAVQSALLHPDTELQAVMNKAQIQRFATVTSQDYHAIAQIYDRAIQAGYEIMS